MGVERDRTIWYTSLSLGTTRFNPDDEDSGEDWRFSMMFGLGAKYSLTKRLGLRFQARFPWTYMGGDGSEIICGEIGCMKSSGGLGLWQFDLSVGVVIAL